MRRLFFTYAGGAPGIALLLMRVAAGVAIVAHPGGPLAWHALRIVSGILMVAGLWTPIAAVLVVFDQAWEIVKNPVSPSAPLLLGIMAAALALLGPGFWSLDSRLFGWRRIDLPQR